MDTGDYDTNTLVVNNISSVNFAFYEPISSSSSLFGSGATEIETALRKDGHLVFLDTGRRGVWSFRFVIKGSSTSSFDASSFERNIECAGFTLAISEEGAFEPAALVKHRFYGPNATNTPGSSSSSASSAFDVAFRSAQSATTPSFPTSAVEHEGKPTRVADSKLSSTASVREVYDYLLSASYSAISSCFCARTGALPLSFRTLLLPSSFQRESIAVPRVLASLRIYMTTTGSLVVSISHSFAYNLITLSESVANQLPPLGVTVLAAPLGMFATCQPYTLTDAATTEGSLGQSPDTQHLRLRPEKDDGTWRNLCSRLLQARTISIPTKATQKWIGLQRLRRKLMEQNVDGKRTPMMGPTPSIFWPASLCFCKAPSNTVVKDEVDEMHRPQTEKGFDPLLAAKTWFSGTAEREARIGQKKRERDAVAVQEVSLTEGQVQTSTSFSPLALHRPTQGGAPVGGMYPTPPDNIQGVVGVAPCMNGNLSSPNNHPATNTAAEMDMASHGPIEAYNDNWAGTEMKRERVGASFESENLFGDLGPDMFEDNDITDADFSFFDEQPDQRLGLTSPDMPDVSIIVTPGLVGSMTAGQAQQVKAGPSHISTSDPVPVFAKPELRHARSSLADEPRRQLVPEMSQLISANNKRPASPFNPDTVYKRIRASLDNQTATQQNSLIYPNQHASIFDKVDFGPSLSMVNSKYEGRGRFDYSMNQPKGNKTSNLDTPPTTDYLRRHGRGRKNLKELPTAYGELFTRMHGNPNPISNRPSPQQMDGFNSDADDVSLLSDQDDSSYDSDEPLSPVKSLSMRRRRADDDGESLATSFRDLETMDVSTPNIPFELSRNSKFEVDIPLARYFADPEPTWVQYSLPDDQFVMAAQILTDQITTSTILPGMTDEPLLQSGVDQRKILSHIARNSMKELQQGIPSHFQPTTGYQLRSFVEVQDVPLLGQPTRLQPRPTGSDQVRPSNLFQIPSPRFEMRRYESRLSVLPSAISFWESLGLSPTHGAKDISALCLFPGYEGVSDSMLVFTDMMRSTYESLKLGSFSRLSSSGDEDGMFPFEVERDLASFGKTTSFLGPSLQNCASRVCKALSTVSAEHVNFVLFFVYTPDVAGSMVECCAAFNEIFEGYKRILTNKRMPIVNEMALQLIPQSLVSSSSSIPMPSPIELSRLALEVYDRCTQFGGAMPSPAVVLEQAPPRSIDFKLKENPSASVLHENTCLHIGYAQSIDGRWITVAWTDNRGSQQMTTSYCLGRKGKTAATPITDIIREIWTTTLELISTWKIFWRIIIAKSGVMDAHEIELWSSLAQPEPKTEPMLNLTLVTVETDPSLQLLPPAARIPNSAVSVFYTTPGSTPQGAVVSPEQSGNAATPFRDNTGTSGQTPGGDNNTTDTEADATLTDTTDHTWGVILSHRLHNLTTLTDLNPALVSGYLVKRGGMRAEDAPNLMEVNIVHSEGNPRAYESLLREMLTYYRGLSTLARARGMVDKDTDIRPWHIAAAEKGVRALYMLM